MLAALFLVALNGLFVTAEFGFTRIRETRVESMVREGRAWADLVREGTRNLDVYLAVCQVGITISSLGLGALGEPAVAQLIEPLLEPFLPENIIHIVAFVIGFAIITFLHVTYGELAAKSIAIARPEESARFTAPIMKFFYYIFAPAIWLFNGTANASVRIFGIPPASEIEDRHSEEELHMLVGQSGRQGILEEREEARVRAALDLDEREAREIMVPKTDVATLPADTRLEELLQAAAEGNNVRCPISDGDHPERIVGAIHVKDVLRALTANGRRTDITARDITAWDIMHDVLIVPQNRRGDRVLDGLQEKGLQMAVVVDEWGAFEGIITIEDILEEIVGEIRDEWEPEPDVRRLDDGSYAIRGNAPIRDVNAALDSDFESAEFGTIGGVVFGTLGHAPEVGDEVRLDGPRVTRLVAHREGD